MSKARLQASRDAYDAEIERALADERAGRLFEAIEHAKAAWEHLDEMMKYERRFENAEFKSVPCVDLVLKHSPSLLDAKSLDALAGVLKQYRSVEKNTTDDLAARLSEARERLAAAHDLWDYLARCPGSTDDQLRSAGGHRLAWWRESLSAWVKAGVARKTAAAGAGGRYFINRLDDPSMALCVSCGASQTAARSEFFGARRCVACGCQDGAVVGGRLEG